MRVLIADKPADDERLEQFKCHLLWQTAFVDLELWTDDNHRATRVVDALTKQVLAESSLLALEHVTDRLQTSSSASRVDSTATTGGTVVDQRVDSFLKHAHLVATDNFRSIELDQLFETIVAVDDASIEIVQVACRETAARQLNHRSKIRWDHRENGKRQAAWLDTCGVHTLKHLEALEKFLLTLPFGTFDFFCQLLDEDWQFDFVKKLLQRRAAHADSDELFVLFGQITVVGFAHQRAFDEAVELRFFDIVCFIELFELFVLSLGKRLYVGSLCFRLFFITNLDRRAASLSLGFEIYQHLVALLRVNAQDDIACKVSDTFEVTNSDPQ